MSKVDLLLVGVTLALKLFIGDGRGMCALRFPMDVAYERFLFAKHCDEKGYSNLEGTKWSTRTRSGLMRGKANYYPLDVFWQKCNQNKTRYIYMIDAKHHPYLDPWSCQKTIQREVWKYWEHLA
jgi:hypothetical protein